LLRLILIAALLIGAEQQPPPAAQPTFRSGAQVVEVDVRVLKDGRFVTDLTAADFQITEDGVPQPVQSLVLIGGAPSAPLAPSAPAPSAPSAPLAPSAPSAPSAPTARQSQLWLFVFDTAHLTPGPFQRAREAAASFISDKFTDGDIGGVVVDGKMANNRLTTDRKELVAAVKAAKMPGDLRSRQLDLREWPRLQDEFEAFRIIDNDREAIATAVMRACADDADACRRGPPDVQVVEKARRMVDAYRLATNNTLVTLNGLCNGLARMPGAKTVVFFSEGFVIERMESELRQVVGQAARAGAHFYSIDARGLNKGVGSQIIDQPYANSTISSGPSFDAQADGTNSLAVDTGGMAIHNENNFGRALDEIQRDAGTYYVVAYIPSNTLFDGKYRTIDVKISRPGVKVRARRGYLALPPSPLLNRTLVAPKPLSEATGATADVAPNPLSEAGAPKADLPSLPLAPRLDPMDALRALGRDTVPVPAPPGAPAAAAAARLRPDAPFGETPPVPNSAAERGWSAYERGDAETAARELSDAARAADARPWVVYALGLAQFALRQPRDAAQSWERVRHEAPEFEPIYFSLADAYALQHEDASALKVLREAETRWPQDPEVANAIGVIQVRRGALDAAIESFERATTVAPSEALGYFNLARAYQMRLAKSQRYDRQMEKWIGGDEDRRRAIANFEKYVERGGPYDRQAREALSALNWKQP